MIQAARNARLAGFAVLLVSYALLVHHVNTSGTPSVLGAFLALTPLIVLGLALAIRRESRIAGVIMLGVLGILAWSQWHLIMQHTGLIFWLQDMSLLLALFMVFGRTLLAGHKPLCVGFAEVMHRGQLPASHQRYARSVTVAWTLFFGLMAVVSTLLFFFMPLPVWSFFVNFLTLPLVALMFIVEYLVRRTLLPDAPAGILGAVKAYRDMSFRKH